MCDRHGCGSMADDAKACGESYLPEILGKWQARWLLLLASLTFLVGCQGVSAAASGRQQFQARFHC